MAAAGATLKERNEDTPFANLKAAGSLVLEQRGRPVEASTDFPALEKTLLSAQGKPKTWTVLVSPSENSRFFAGAVNLSGIALRAVNPVPTEPRVFHLPNGPGHTALLSPGESQKCSKAAIEFRTGGLRTALLLDQGTESPSFAAAAFTDTNPRNLSWEIETFMASNRARADSEDTWFIDGPQLPARSVASGGLGTRVTIKGFSLNLQGMLSSTGIGGLWGGTNGEVRVALRGLSLSAGFSSFARNYPGIYGNKPKTYERAYVTPTINMEKLFPAFSLLRVGALLSRSIQRSERPWEKDPLIDTQALALQGKWSSLGFSLGMEKKQTRERYETSLTKGFSRFWASELSLKFTAEGESSWWRKGEYGFSSNFLVQPQPFLTIEGGFSGSVFPDLGLVKPAAYTRLSMKWADETALAVKVSREELAAGYRIAFSAGLYQSFH